jgi:hypothetical protein
MNLRISQVVAFLESVRQRHGDIEVTVLDENFWLVGVGDIALWPSPDFSREYLGGDLVVSLTQYPLSEEPIESLPPKALNVI